jgi:dTDP-L-rhamnose 4-epimerase
VLITGGAGFIGAHLSAALLERGAQVRALDSLEPQIHPERERPQYLHPDVELVVGDVRDARAVDRALAGVDAVVHLAARVGVGQSMYEIASYTAVNALGTAVLLEALTAHEVRTVVVASSMSIYGEGAMVDADQRPTAPVERTRRQLEVRQWEPVGANGQALFPVPTREDKTPALSSVYALGKYDQERMCLLFGDAYAVPTTALRLFNVYGPHQALSNPYTGVLAIFASRLLNGNRPMIFEDGLQRRDFVNVRDVAEAFCLALERPAPGRAINIGSGCQITVEDVARRLAHALGRDDIEPERTGRFRVGDIRHCFADIGSARELLGFGPSCPFDDGISELAEWLRHQPAVDRVAEAMLELSARGLTA